MGTLGDVKYAELGLGSVPLCWASRHKLFVSSELQFFCLQVSSKGVYTGWPMLKGDAGGKGPREDTVLNNS